MNTFANEYAFADRALACRLERTESAANASFVEARARATPETGAVWIDVDGTWAMFDGVGSPLTQTFGFGLFTSPLESQLDVLENFFISRGGHVHHEVSPMSDPETLLLLGSRGYRPIEQSSVTHRPIGSAAIKPPAEGVRVRAIGRDEVPAWADLSARGWSEYPELGDFMRAMGAVVGASQHTVSFIAEVNGVAAATGSLSMYEGVALFAGASTVPAFRGRGAQNALLNARLEYAKAHGCDLAMMVAAPGSASQRNAERQGFRVAYTRTKWAKS